MNNMPNITQAQIAAVITAVVGQIVAWGWVNNDNAQLVISIGSFVLASVWKMVDAYLRGQRNKRAAVTNTAITTPTTKVTT